MSPSCSKRNGFLDRRNVFALKNSLPGTTFFSLQRAKQVNKLNLNVDMVADTDFWIRLTNYSPVSENAILRVDKIWSCAIVHEEQRSVDQCKFSLGRAKMFRCMLNNPKMDLPYENKLSVFRANLIDAFDYYYYQNKDNAALVSLWKEVFREDISWKWKLKSILI